MGFDEPREGDMPLEVDGVKVLIAPPRQPLLQAHTCSTSSSSSPAAFNFIFIADRRRPKSAARNALRQRRLQQLRSAEAGSTQGDRQ